MSSSSKKRSRSSTGESKRPVKTRKVSFDIQDGPTTLTASFIRGFPPQSLFTEDVEITHQVPKVDELTAKTVDASLVPHKLDIKAEKVSYSGNSTDQKGAPKYYIGVYDKQSNNLSVLPTKLFTLDQHIAVPKTKHVSVKPVGNVTREQLVHKFSGAKAMRKFKQIQESLTPVSRIEGLDRKAEKEEVTRDDLPPYDPNTKDPSEIYDIDSICGAVSTVELHIAAFKKAVKKDDVASLSNVPLLVIDGLNNIRRDMKKETLDDALAKCILLRWMIEFYQNFKQTRGRSQTAKNVPSDVNRELLARYAAPSGNRWDMPAALEKKIIHHILILALAVNNYKIDATRAAKDLLMVSAVCTNHFFSIGCKIRKSKEEDPDTGDEIERRWGVLVGPLVLNEKTRLPRK